MADPSTNARTGLLNSLTGLAGTLLGIARTRLELFATELELGREHLVSMVLTLLAASFCFGVAALLATFALVSLYWESHRLIALGAIAAMYTVIGVCLMAYARYRAARSPRMFSASLGELAKDHQAFGSRS